MIVTTSTINNLYNLYEQLLLPIMEYISVITYTLSRSRLATLQMIKNRAQRQAYNDTSYPPRFTTEELHRNAGLKPINQRFIYKANNIWNIIQGMKYPHLKYEREKQLREGHHHFPKSRTRLEITHLRVTEKIKTLETFLEKVKRYEKTQLPSNHFKE